MNHNLFSNVKKQLVLALLVCMLLVGGLATASAAPGDIERVSVDSSGTEANDASGFAAISGNGRYTTFASVASNLVSGDTNGRFDAFVHDRDTDQTTRVSVDSSGNQANGDSYATAISSDGRFIAFYSVASNLVSSDSNGRSDVFVHDRDTGETTRVSVDSSGNEGNGNSSNPAISSDGRFVAFVSEANNLVSGDTNNERDVFVHDRDTGETTRVSVDSSGNQANADSSLPAISGNGRFVAFFSFASNLVSGDSNASFDVFVHDRDTGETTRVSVDSNGNEASGASLGSSISSDGRFVTFVSSASNLVSGDTNGRLDIFVHDRDTGETTRVSVASNGNEGNGDSDSPAISSDGRFVTFYATASNLVSGDTNGVRDIFVYDRSTGETTRVSVDSSGVEGNDDSFSPVISSDGRFVAFVSDASNLVSGDSNGELDLFVKELAVTGLPASCDPSSGFNVIHGTAGNDKITGTPDNDIIFGYGGNDRIEGLGGNDCLVGGDRHDTLFGGEGDDILWGGDVDNATSYSSDNDKLYGDEGDDELHGGDRDDRLEGNEGDDQLFGDGRRDKLYGGDGDDYLEGGDDRDTLDGGDGNDTMLGGEGDDHLTGKDGDDHLEGEAGRDKLYGGEGDDTLDGGSEDDTLTANNGNDVLYGGSGKDRLDGGHGEDELYGEDGDDKLYAGQDDDLLDGGADDDYLDGSSGTDSCLNGENLRSCELP